MDGKGRPLAIVVTGGQRNDGEVTDIELDRPTAVHDDEVVMTVPVGSSSGHDTTSTMPALLRLDAYKHPAKPATMSHERNYRCDHTQRGQEPARR